MYKQIEKLQTLPQLPESVELMTLGQVWSEKKSKLRDSGAYKDFLARLQREWAIETGIIERLYTWDRGVTEILIEQGIEATIIAHNGGLNQEEANHVKNLIDDHLSIVEYLFSFVKGDEPLTEHFIKSIHAKFTNQQQTTDALTTAGMLVQVSLARGEYKHIPNNPKRPDGVVHEYCPPILVSEEMENLLKWYHEAEKENVAPEVLAAWIHHAFTQIHPFQDGNGRVARAIASLVFLRADLLPLVIREEDRKEYITALEVADDGDLTNLIRLFIKRQRRALLGVMELQNEVEEAHQADQIISATVQLLKNKFSNEAKKYAEVFKTAQNLHVYAAKKIANYEQSLGQQLRTVRNGLLAKRYSAKVDSAGNDDISRRRYYYNQVIQTARALNYYVNVNRYHSWIKLSIRTETNFEFVLSFHGFGREDNGLMAISAFTSLRVPKSDGESGGEVVGCTPACIDMFQFNYAEEDRVVCDRFDIWFDDAVRIGLGEWYRSQQS